MTMSVNKAILLGNVGREPEIRYIESNVPVARISLATSERAFTTANGTKVPERSEWHTVIAWRGLAEIVEKYVHKGTQIYVEGRITYRSWDDKNGVTRYATEIIADNLQLLGPRKNDTAPAPQPPVPTEPIPSTPVDVNNEPF